MAKVYSGRNSEFIRLISSMTNRYQTWEIWSDFITMIALALSQPLDYRNDREKRYLDTAAKHSREEINNFVVMAQMLIESFENNRDQDLLGSLYMELELGNHWTGQFFTPYNVCKVMAQNTVYNAAEIIYEKGFITINDCACGAGATLIAGVNSVREQLRKAESPLNFQDHILVIAQDLSEITALMCYIQLSLLGIAAIVKVGDSIINPFNYDVLTVPHNADLYFTPMYFSDVWNGRKTAHIMDMALNGSAVGLNSTSEKQEKRMKSNSTGSLQIKLYDLEDKNNTD